MSLLLHNSYCNISVFINVQRAKVHLQCNIKIIQAVQRYLTFEVWKEPVINDMMQKNVIVSHIWQPHWIKGGNLVPSKHDK